MTVPRYTLPSTTKWLSLTDKVWTKAKALERAEANVGKAEAARDQAQEALNTANEPLNEEVARLEEQVQNLVDALPEDDWGKPEHQALMQLRDLLDTASGLDEREAEEIEAVLEQLKPSSHPLV